MDMFQRILGIILPVFVIIGLGYIYARLRGESVRSDMVQFPEHAILQLFHQATRSRMALRGWR